MQQKSVVFAAITSHKAYAHLSPASAGSDRFFGCVYPGFRHDGAGLHPGLYSVATPQLKKESRGQAPRFPTPGLVI